MSLGERSISAVFWGAGGVVLRIALQFGAQVVLARILGPGEYGVFAIASIIVGLCSFFADFGLAYGLIQKREVSSEDIRFAFTWQIIVGALVTALIALLSPLIALFFGEPRAQPVIALLGLICLVNAAAGTAMNLLKRKLDFKTQQLASVLSYLVGFFGVGIPMALTDHGVWSLASAWLTQVCVWALLLYRAARHPLRPLLWYSDGRMQTTYGLTVLRTNVLNWFLGNADRIVIGRVLPVREIGLYATIYNAIYAPSASILSVIQPVFFSASSRVAEAADADPAHKLARGFVTLIALVCLYLLPVFVTAAVLADDFVLAVYGPAWQDASAVLRPLALAMPFSLCLGLTTPLLWASGRSQDEFGKQWPIALAWTIACWGLARLGGIEAVGWGVLGLFAARFGTIMQAATRVAAVRWQGLWRGSRGGIAISLVVAVVTAGTDHGLRAGGLVPAARVLGASLAALVTFCVTLRLLPALIAPEAAGLMAGIFKRLPPTLAARLGRLRGLGGTGNE